MAASGGPAARVRRPPYSNQRVASLDPGLPHCQGPSSREPLCSASWIAGVVSGRKNDLADRFAKKGALSVGRPSASEIEAWVDESASLRRYLQYAVRALLLYPRLAPSKAMRSTFNARLRAPGFKTGIGAARQAPPSPPPLTPPSLPPLPAPPVVASSAAAPANPKGHDRAWRRTRWACQRCLRFVTSDRKPAPNVSPCPGYNAAFSALVANPRGHRLRVANYSHGVDFICGNCGA